VFHDGSAMTRADVVASLKRWLELSTPGRRYLARHHFVRGARRHTVQFTFSRPIGALLLSALAFSYQAPPSCRPSSRGARGGRGHPVPIGTGPFKHRLDPAWQPGAPRAPRGVRLARRAEPIGMGGGKTAYLDAVVLFVAPEAAVRASGLEAGDFDFALGLPAMATRASPPTPT
jgi:peptide/nickel transport system substrate-binding protein